MSVLIKDMVMPRCCYNCKLDLRTDVCSAFLEWQKEHPYSIKSNDRLPNCPLVEVSEPYDDCISRQAAIDTEGLDAQIRCEMCRNPMHTDRGCDGNCKYDEKLYERIIQILGERIKPLPSAQPQYEELTPEEAASEIASGSTMSAWHWLDDMTRLKRMRFGKSATFFRITIVWVSARLPRRMKFVVVCLKSWD